MTPLCTLGSTGIAQWEIEAEQQGRAVGQAQLRQRIQQWIDAVEWPKHLPDPAGGEAYHLHEWRSRQFNTAVGCINIRMPEYRKTGRDPLFPGPAALGMLDSISPRLANHLGSLAAELSFARVAAEVRDLLAVDVSTSTVRKISVLLGEHALAQQLRPTVPAAFAEPIEIRVYLDGGRLRTVVPDRKWVEPRLARIELRNKLGDVHTVILSRICSAEEFWALLHPLLVRLGAALCKRLAFFGDGATWILQEAQSRFEHGIFILDCNHACEHIHEAGKECFGDTPRAAEWSSDLCTRLKRGQITTILIELRFASHPAQLDLLGYLEPRREFLRYKTFKRDGWPMGSGPIEGLVKQALNLRLKRTGSRWTIATAEQLLALRCAKISGALSQVWQSLIESKTAEVPPLFTTLFDMTSKNRAA